MQMGWGGGVLNYLEKWVNNYEGVTFNVIGVSRGWVGVQIPGKRHYVTLEWPLNIMHQVGLKCALIISVNDLTFSMASFTQLGADSSSRKYNVL